MNRMCTDAHPGQALAAWPYLEQAQAAVPMQQLGHQEDEADGEGLVSLLPAGCPGHTPHAVESGRHSVTVHRGGGGDKQSW